MSGNNIKGVQQIFFKFEGNTNDLCISPHVVYTELKSFIYYFQLSGRYFGTGDGGRGISQFGFFIVMTIGNWEGNWDKKQEFTILRRLRLLLFPLVIFIPFLYPPPPLSFSPVERTLSPRLIWLKVLNKQGGSWFVVATIVFRTYH